MDPGAPLPLSTANQEPCCIDGAGQTGLLTTANPLHTRSRSMAESWTHVPSTCLCTPTAPQGWEAHTRAHVLTPHTRCTLAGGGWISLLWKHRQPPVPTSSAADSCPLRKRVSLLRKAGPTWTWSTRAASGRSWGAAREGGGQRAAWEGGEGPWLGNHKGT